MTTAVLRRPRAQAPEITDPGLPTCPRSGVSSAMKRPAVLIVGAVGGALLVAGIGASAHTALLVNRSAGLHSSVSGDEASGARVEPNETPEMTPEPADTPEAQQTPEPTETPEAADNDTETNDDDQAGAAVQAGDQETGDHESGGDGGHSGGGDSGGD